MYRLAVALLELFYRSAAWVHPKARAWVAMRQEQNLAELTQLRKHKQAALWVHAASVGEWEMIAPVLKAWRTDHPDHFVGLTFYSPSGKSAQITEGLIDWQGAFPFEKSSAVHAFVNALQPNEAWFVKAELWWSALSVLQHRSIPYFLVAMRQKAGQDWYWRQVQRPLLNAATAIFCQDSATFSTFSEHISAPLFLTGNPRVDRVVELTKEALEVPLIEQWAAQKTVLIAGSTWAEDERHLAKAKTRCTAELGWMIAPHDISYKRIAELKTYFPKGKLLSELQQDDNPEVIIVDCLGLLAKLYRFGDLAYIGGGFGAGIHNTLEPAAYFLPVAFGPKFHKFAEAEALVSAGGFTSIRTAQDVNNWLEVLFKHPAEKTKRTAIIRSYMEENQGATQRFLEQRAQLLP